MTTDHPTPLASMLEERRILRGLSKTQAAKEIGVSARTYRYYLKGGPDGIDTPHREHRQAIARFLEMDEIELTAALNGLALGVTAEKLRELIRREVDRALGRAQRPDDQAP